MAIATSSSSEAVKCKMSKKKDFFDKFHHFVCGNDDPEVLRGKPFPNIYFVAARRLDMDIHKNVSIVGLGKIQEYNFSCS